MEFELICCICYSESDEKARTKCNHVICESCIKQLRNTKCPICRIDPLSNEYVTSEILLQMENRRNEDRLSHEIIIPLFPEIAEEPQGIFLNRVPQIIIVPQIIAIRMSNMLGQSIPFLNEEYWRQTIGCNYSHDNIQIAGRAVRAKNSFIASNCASNVVFDSDKVNSISSVSLPKQNKRVEKSLQRYVNNRNRIRLCLKMKRSYKYKR